MANLIRVMTKARKHYPSVATDYEVNFDNGTITVYRNGVKGKTFAVNDSAEYDSYNLNYVGTITKITEKCVTIVAYKGYPNMEKTHRLSLNEFCWRNFDFDLAETEARNHETMMYI